jgi:phosphoribosylformylglycinamidine cyclo-ligase
MGLTYRESGVDIEKGNRFTQIIKDKLKKSEQANIGLFGGVFDLDLSEYKNPVLVSGTDGVGTKLLLAKEAKNYSTIGLDLVAMCVNDIITLGAKPLFFLDYIAAGVFDLEIGSQIIDGIIKGCGLAECTLLGGETAEMPGVYSKGDYELAGFAVGIAEKASLIDGKSIHAGDVLVGVRSNGVHSNGLSLARRALFGSKKFSYDTVHPFIGKTLVEELLIPTKIYVKTVLETIKRVPLQGIAHITGGGFVENVRRLLPEGLSLKICWKRFDPHPIFTLIAEAGDIDIQEMRRTYNMGIGMVFIVREDRAEELISFLKRSGDDPRIVGEVTAG